MQRGPALSQLSDDGDRLLVHQIRPIDNRKMVDPPAEVRAAAAGLGSLQRFEWLVTRNFYYLITVELALIGVAGLAFLGWLTRRPPGEGWLRIVVLVPAVSLLVWMLMVALRQARKVGAVDLYEYEGGFVRASGSETVVFDWEGVEFLESASSEGGALRASSRRRVYYLRKRNVPGHTIEPLQLHRDIDRIAALVMAATLPATLAAAHTDFGTTFGPLSLGPFGVTAIGVTIPWTEVDKVVREYDEIRVYRTGQTRPWARSPVSIVPSAALVLAIAAHLRAEHHQAP